MPDHYRCDSIEVTLLKLVILFQGLQHRCEILKLRWVTVRHFSQIVPTAQLHRVFGVRLLDESRGSLYGKRPSLEF
jgi:hypothetical protein